MALLSNSTSFVYGVFVRTTGVVISQASISVFGIPTPLTGLPSGQGLGNNPSKLSSETFDQYFLNCKNQFLFHRDLLDIRMY